MANRTLVTGGAGFIGSHLVRGLLDAGHEVTVLDDLSSGFRDNLADIEGRIRFIQGSILDDDSLEQSAQGARCIFHLAAVANVPQSVRDPIGTHRVNSEGTLRVLQQALKNESRVILSSSSAVYGDGPELPKRETTPIEPTSPYAVQKLNSEDYLQMEQRLHGLEGFALRYFNVFGPRQNPESEYAAVIPKFIVRALRGEAVTIFGDGKQTRDFIYVKDVVRANLLAMEAQDADGTALNIGSGMVTDLNELARMVFSAVGGAENVIHAPEREGDIKHSSCEAKLAKKRLGFEAQTTMAEGLMETVDSYRTPVL
jgi:UDP-glucose 4-epimerase